MEYSRKEPGKVIFGNGLWAWDSASGEIVYHAFFSDPAMEHVRAKIVKPGVFKGMYTGSLEVKKVRAACELYKDGPGDYTFKTKGVAASGLGELDVRFTRVNAADQNATAEANNAPPTPAVAQESSREDFQEFCEAIQGRWVGDVTWVADWPGLGKRGEKVTCYFEGRLAEDGNVITGKWYGGAGSGTGLYYFDAGAKQIKWIWVNSGGQSGRGILFKKDGHWVEKGSGSLADGRKTAHTSTLTITDNGNIHTYTGTGTVGEEKTDDRHDVWRRVSK